MEKLKFLKKKRILIPALSLASLLVGLAVLGGIIGYFLTKHLANRQVIKSWIFKIGRYRLHFHHWLVGAGLLVLGLFDVLPIFQGAFSQGFIIGLIAQGIFDYSDWYKLIIK